MILNLSLTLVDVKLVCLLCRGADPNIENDAGLTVLDLAYGYGDQKGIDILENFGGRHGSSYSEEYVQEYLAFLSTLVPTYHFQNYDYY